MNKRFIITSMLLAFIMSFNDSQNALALDLSAAGSSGFVNGAFFSRTAVQGSGTGSIDPFVRIQGDGSEKGYNTDGVLEFDTKASPHTHSLLINAVPIVNIDGINYREFLLDTAEPSGNSLTINTLKFYLLSAGDIANYAVNIGTNTAKYDLDGAGDTSILLDNLTSGNGNADMFAYIPTSSFSGTNQYLYLYSEFNQAEGSFEEWAIKTDSSSTVVPEPSTLSILGLGLFGFLKFRKRKEVNK